MTMPPTAVCDRARQTRDARFDGLFFTGVRSTRVYCRPVCPAPAPKRQNIVYFPTASAAVDAGYRPCLRCRPELAPDIKPDDLTVRRALALISDGWLDEGTVESLAAQMQLSGRHLRRLFVDHVGAPPLKVHQTRRLLLAKQLLSETALPITDVGLAAGFASIRRFNSAFKDAFKVAPSSIRRGTALRAMPVDPCAIELRLAYRPPLDFAAALSTLAARALPGIERVLGGRAFERGVSAEGRAAWIRVTSVDSDHVPRRHELRLVARGLAPSAIHPLVGRVRRLFDLDADLEAAHRVLADDATLASSIAMRPGLRLVGTWDGFEAAARTVVVAHVGEAASRVVLGRLIDAFGTRVDGAPVGLDRTFPATDRIAVAPLESLLGATASMSSTLRALAAALRDRRFAFRSGRPLDECVANLVAATGISPSLARHIAVDAQDDPDASHGEDPQDARTAAWRPWRAYAALHLRTVNHEDECLTIDRNRT